MTKYILNIMKGVVFTAIMIQWICPDLFALDGGSVEYGGELLKSEGAKLKTLTKPALAIGGVVGFIIGGFQAFKQSALGPLMTWFGIGAACLGLNGLLGTSMFSALIPF